MAATCRFAFAVHILTVLAYKEREGGTSDLLAHSLNTHPVIVRRLLSDLRNARLVETQKGSRGGSRLSRCPREITLDEIYRAIEGGPMFSPHPHRPNRRCPVGRKIEAVLDEVFASAEEAMQQALALRTLADVLETATDSASSGPFKAA